MMRTNLLFSLVVLVSACSGDDGVPHLADAPDLPIDARADAAAPDAPDLPIDARADAGAPDAPDLPIDAPGDAAAPDAPNLPIDAPADAPSPDVKQLSLRVAKNPNQEDGVGTVTGNGLNCGTACATQTVTVSYGTSVSLSAVGGTTSSTLSTFTGWSGGNCTGTDGCTFTITANTTVFAAFKLRPNLMFVTSSLTTGAFIGIKGADSLCKNLATVANLPGSYLAYVSGTGIGAASRFAGVSGWVRVDNAPVMNAIGQFGGGTLFNPPVLDEAGTSHAQSNSPFVWTATDANGTYFGQNCNNTGSPADWSTTSARTLAGLLTATDSTAVAQGVRPCAELSHIYCLGVDRAATVP